MYSYDLDDRKNEPSEFVEELIIENIDLMNENIRLIYENKRLRERVKDIERFYKVFGISCLLEEFE